jgi:hypothetical protein
MTLLDGIGSTVTIANDPAARKWWEWNGFWPVKITPTTCVMQRCAPPGFRFLDPKTWLPYPEPPRPRLRVI